MNKIWLIVCTICISILTIINPTNVLPSLFNATHHAIELSFTLLASYAIWLGLFEIIKQTRIPTIMAKILSPLITLIYGKNTINKETLHYLSLSMSSNILGTGGASTALSIKTIESMAGESTKVNFAITMFVVINATGLQILPTTIITLLASMGDTNPGKIIIPSLIASTISTIIGIILVKIFVKRGNGS